MCPPPSHEPTPRAATLAETEAWFAIYVSLPRRTNPALHERLGQLGIQRSFDTVRRRARRFRFRERAAELDRLAAAETGSDAARERVAMDGRHAQIARALLGAGGEALLTLVSDPERIQELTAAEIARLVDLGIRSERSSTGAATTRAELAIEVANGLTEAVVEAFNAINSIVDPGDRARQFAARVDAAITQRLALLTEGIGDA